MLLASDESEEIQVDVTISLNMSREEAPPCVSQELESTTEFEQGFGVTNSLLLVLRGERIEHAGDGASELLVIDAGVEASSDKSAADDMEFELELNDDEEHS